MGWINSQGYNMIYKNGKEIREHRLIAEEALGVPIPEDILVHHIDGNKLNNDVLNLQLITREEHPKVHYTGVPRTQEVKNKVSQSKMGHTVSEETRRKISKTLTGRKQSKESIAKKSGKNGYWWKDYARVVKNGIKPNGKQEYGLNFQGKTIKYSIDKEKLLKIAEEINSGRKREE